MTLKTGLRQKILGISGSTRSTSSNESILNTIGVRHKDAIDLHIYGGIANLPHFNPDLTGDATPQAVKDFQQEISQADGVIICTPEYVFSLPGSLKNALEWTVATTVFSDKPVALIVASGLGEKAFESLQLIMKTIQASFTAESTLLLKGARSKVNATSGFCDEGVLQEVDKVIYSLLDAIEKAPPVAAIDIIA